jgi:2-hydroxychromene-2-carboxylate isomerase
MGGWKMTMIEPTLEDLLDDEIMTPVMRSAGLDAAELRARLAETARRLAETLAKPVTARRSCRAPEMCCTA